MAENEKIEWVGCQWMMQGYCGRKAAAQRAEGEPRPAQPTRPTPPTAATPADAAVEQPPALRVDASALAEPAAPGAKARPRKAPRGDAWSAARKEAAAKRRRRPAA